MLYLPSLMLALLVSNQILAAQSNLLESVKKNPNEAISLCSKFKQLNSRGISASSKEAIAEVALQRNLSEIDAEILSIYVIGLHCPEVQ